MKKSRNAKVGTQFQWRHGYDMRSVMEIVRLRNICKGLFSGGGIFDEVRSRREISEHGNSAIFENADL